MLLDKLLELMAGWSECLPRVATLCNAQRVAISQLLPTSRHTITAGIAAVGREQQDWSATYKLFSRSPWEPGELFGPVRRFSADVVSGPFIPLSYDDTAVKRNGRKIPGTQFLYDPQSPPFRANLLHGLRFGHAAFLYRQSPDAAARALPVDFLHLPVVKKPGKRATDAEREAYKEAKKRQNLSQYFVAECHRLRHWYDELGLQATPLLMVTDGSYANRACLTAKMDRVDLLTRTRKNAVLCFPAPLGGRRFYGREKFTPQDVRQDNDRPWQACGVVYGSTQRTVRYKEVNGVLWQGGARRRPLRLIVLAPTAYRTSPRSRRLYRQPAYLLTTDLDTPAELLIQAYLDRWQCEVAHRDLKSILGIHHAQVWSEASVPRYPAFMAAVYSLLLVASIISFGDVRGEHYPQLPAWRKEQKRPSCRDLVRLLNDQLKSAPDWEKRLGIALRPAA